MGNGHRIVRAALLAIGALGFARGELHAAPTTKAARQRAAAEFVEEALAAELAGDLGRRSALLSAARNIEPEFARARWQSGEVHFDGRWRSVDEVGRLVSTDRRWEAYRRLRSSMGQTPSDHLMLARWCRRNRLATEARYHWMHVLSVNPNHEEAQRRLGVCEYRGGLYSYELVAQFKKQAKVSKKNLAHYKPIFLQYRREAERGSPVERDAALTQLRAVSAPDAIESLAAVLYIKPNHSRELSARLGKDKAGQLVLDFNLAFIAALGNMPEYDATVRLANCAVFAPDEVVRREAAKALKPREATSYVPMLMSSLAAPIDGVVRVEVALDGSVTVVEELSQAGFDTDREMKNVNTYQTVRLRQGIGGRRLGGLARQPATGRDYQRAATHAAITSAQVNAANVRARRTNERIAKVLETTTGLVLGSEPEAWWTAWQKYNELYYPEDKPVYQTYRYKHHYREMPVSFSSCFVAGTPVWTDRGPISIENIGVGDMVLSQDPISAELAFKPVLKTTTRPPTPTVRIVLPGETVTATRGHRFWLIGRGWRMAKFLKPGARLRSLDGPVKIQTIDDGEEFEAYNLVVSEFNTYFVGDGCVLVHDNSCPRPTSAPIPGMVPRSETNDLLEN